MDIISTHFTTNAAEDQFKQLLQDTYGTLKYTRSNKTTYSITVPEEGVIITPPPPPPPPTDPTILFQADFNGADGLITNEFAFWSPTSPNAKISNQWEMDSGSLFIKGNQGWSGVPDSGEVDALSLIHNDSSVFRLTTKQKDFLNFSTEFKLTINKLGSTSFTPPVAWDGIHIFLRYQSEYDLYYASVSRRDGTCVIKRKTPGGPSNNGTYWDLTNYVPHAWTPGSLQNVKASIQTQVDNTVLIILSSDGKEIVRCIDNGSKSGGVAPIRTAGKTGIRGDNADFLFDDFIVRQYNG